jgi:hypothetical protein
MCLTIVAVAGQEHLEQLKAVAAVLPSSALKVKVELYPPKWMFWRTPMAVCHINEGCACDLLTESANWNAQVWDMLPEKLPALTETLSALGEKGPDGLRIEVLWLGDKSEREIQVAPHEIADLARKSQLGTKQTYVISKRSAV